MSYSTLIESGDSSASRKAIVRLYANQSSQDYYVQNTGTIITGPLEYALDQLINYGAIPYYRVEYFTGSYPKLTQDEVEAGDWESYIANNNYNDRTGIHHLVHGYGCDDSNCEKLEMAGGEFADDCDDTPSGFATGVAAWSSTTSSWSDGLKKNAAIQEPLHGFIRFHDDDVHPLAGVSSGTADININENKEHALGEIYNNKISPMITFHTGEVSNEGDCDGDGSSPVEYGQKLTYCTKEAINRVENDPCPDS